MTGVVLLEVSLRGMTGVGGIVVAPEGGERKGEGTEGSIGDDIGGSLGWHTGEVGAGQGKEKFGLGIGGAMGEGKESGYVMGLKGEERTS